MMVDALKAYRFVNTHAPIAAQLLYEDGHPTKLFILSDAVDVYGRVFPTIDTVSCTDGKVDLVKVRDILGY